MKRILFFILTLASFNLAVGSPILPGQVDILNTEELTNPDTKSKLYPNPAIDFIVIKNSSSVKIKNISVLSMVGSTMISREISDSNNTHELNVSKLPTGRYFVKISYMNGKLEVLTLIKI